MKPTSGWFCNALKIINHYGGPICSNSFQTVFEALGCKPWITFNLQNIQYIEIITIITISCFCRKDGFIFVKWYEYWYTYIYLTIYILLTYTGNRSCIRLHMDMGPRDLSSIWTSVFGPDILYVFLCSLSFWYEPHSNLRLLVTGGISLLYLSGCGNTGNIGNSTYIPIQVWYLRWVAYLYIFFQFIIFKCYNM